MQKSSICGETQSTSSPPPKVAAHTLLAQTKGSGGVRIKTRSVEGVIYLLGEIARGELWPRSSDPTPFVPNLRYTTCHGGREVVFRVNHDTPAGAIAVTYEGATYAVPVDPTGCDRSAQVLEIVMQLLALNSSAKDLPAPNIIPLISR